MAVGTGEADMPSMVLTGVAFAIADATRLMRAAFDERMRAVGLRGSSWRVLAYLYRDDGLSQAELARLLEVTRAATGQMVDQLEESGHVQRRPDPLDGRRWRVFLSAHARAGIGDVFEVVRRFDEDLRSVFTGDELSRLRELVERLRDQAADLNTQNPAGQP